MLLFPPSLENGNLLQRGQGIGALCGRSMKYSGEMLEKRRPLPGQVFFWFWRSFPPPFFPSIQMLPCAALYPLSAGGGGARESHACGLCIVSNHSSDRNKRLLRFYFRDVDDPALWRCSSIAEAYGGLPQIERLQNLWVMCSNSGCRVRDGADTSSIQNHVRVKVKLNKREPKRRKRDPKTSSSSF